MLRCLAARAARDVRRHLDLWREARQDPVQVNVDTTCVRASVDEQLGAARTLHLSLTIF